MINFTLLIFIFVLQTFIYSLPHKLWPWPQEYSHGELSKVLVYPCKFRLNLLNHTSIFPEMEYIFELYKQKAFKNFECNHDYIITEKEMIEKQNALTVILTTNVSSIYYQNPNDTQEEKYYLEITINQTLIKTSTYIGYIRALETLFQMINCSIIDNNNYEDNKRLCLIENLPLKITDYPTFSYRGIMVDTSRHYYPKESLMKLFDGMMHAKLNVFHWHITDTDSFPLYLVKFPEVSKYGAFSPDEIYKPNDIQEIIQYATKRGIRIIPEIDTPSHTLSWGFSPNFKDVILCEGDGVIDISNNKTTQLIDAIWEQITQLYPDIHVHFGMDEVPLGCWTLLNQSYVNNRSLIQVAQDYKQSLKNRTQGKKHIVWFRNSEEFAYQPDEILQYWDGSYSISDTLRKYHNNSFIISPMDILYLDCGTGNAFGDGSWCGNYHGYQAIYNFDPITMINQSYIHQVLGAEACLWSERSNADVLEIRIWPRVLSMAERFWSNSTKLNNSDSMGNRLIAMINHIRKHGIKSEPLTSGYCERTNHCF